MLDVLAAVVALSVVAAAFTGSIAWGLRDFRSRDAGFVWLLLLWIFSPLTIIAWFMLRPEKLSSRTVEDFDHAEDQIEAAVKLDSLGDVEEAYQLLTDALMRWPDHYDYVTTLLNDLKRRRPLKTDNFGVAPE